MDPLGGYGFFEDSTKRIVLYPLEPNEYSRNMGYMKRDVLVSINGKKIKTQGAAQQIKEIEAGLKPNQKMKVKVLRKNSQGKEVPQTLVAPITPIV